MNQSTVANVTDLRFEADVLSSNVPVLVDFWAEWCAPCRALFPLIEELSAEYSGRVTLVKLNVDQNPEIPAKFGVRGIPTILIFKDGKPVGEIFGRQPKATFEKALDRALALTPAEENGSQRRNGPQQP